jgi:hypothetical protein
MMFAPPFSKQIPTQTLEEKAIQTSNVRASLSLFISISKLVTFGLCSPPLYPHSKSSLAPWYECGGSAEMKCIKKEDMSVWEILEKERGCSRMKMAHKRN